MSKAYNPVQIAWKILDLAKKHKLSITHMQLQKLVYIAHGYCLAALGRPLISEQVTAWKYGPVIPTIYQEFKRFGGSVIAPSIHHCYQLLNADEEQLLDSVVQAYGALSGVQLSELTHRPGSPWFKVWNSDGHNRDNAVIPNFVIKEQYERLLCGQDDRCL